ncbi:hypothetical protein GBA52_018923 [Prunus armeniaca]|nr:hypothetical protein GBA52_018923 [Prunus armeniaca]
MDNLLFIDEAQSLSPLMKGSILGQCDHFVNVLPHCTCPCSSGLDAAMFKELSSEASQKCFSLVRRPVELRDFPAMSHCQNSATIINNGSDGPHGEEDEDAETVHLSGVEGSADLRDAMLHLLLTLSTVPVAVANAIAIAIPKPYKTVSFAPLLFPNLLSMSHGFWIRP